MHTPTLLAFTLPWLAALCATACQPAAGGVTGAPSYHPRPGDVALGHGYVRRDGAIHFLGGGVTGVGADATRIDTPSRRLLRKVAARQYGPFQTCSGLDVASFAPLSEQYTRDKDSVYFKIISPGEFLVVRLPNADPASFEVLATHLARDRNHVWYYDRIQGGIDPATVESVDGGQAFKDKDSVHYGDRRIVGADPAGFRHLGSAYFADRGRVYWGDVPVAGADPAGMQVLGGSFVAKDESNVYRSGERLPHLDAATIELILHDPMGHQFLSDRNGVYLNAMVFPRTVPGRVEVIDHLTVRAGDLVHLVSTYHGTPVTVFEEDGKLMAETFAYDPASRRPLGTITAEVAAAGLEHLRISPLPGRDRAPAVPAWQIEVFRGAELVERMLAAGERLR